MKHLFTFTATLALFLLFAGGCKEDSTPPVVGGSVPMSENWIDENTLRIWGEGFLSAEHTNKPVLQRKELACRAAQLDAMQRAAQKLFEGRSSSAFGEIEETGRMKRFSGYIRNGSVIKKDFDGESNSCRVLYEIQEKGLKSRAASR